MPPRYSYWTIIAGGLPTAFRAAERDELMPTFTRLREKHPDAEMKWFARGRLWDTPDAARNELERRRGDSALSDREARRMRARSKEGRGDGEDAKRQPGWRPGGEHRDPRQKYVEAKKTRNLDRRREKFARKHGAEDRTRTTGPREGGPSARPEHPRRQTDAHGQQRFRDGRTSPHETRGPRDAARGDSQRPWNQRREGTDRAPRQAWNPSHHDAPRRPWNERDGATGGGKRPWDPRPGADRGTPTSPRNARDGATGGEKRPWNPRHGEGGGPPKRSWNERDDAGGAGKRPWNQRRDAGGDAPKRWSEPRGATSAAPKRSWNQPRDRSAPNPRGAWSQGRERDGDRGKRPWEQPGGGGRSTGSASREGRPVRGDQRRDGGDRAFRPDRPLREEDRRNAPSTDRRERQDSQPDRGRPQYRDHKGPAREPERAARDRRAPGSTRPWDKDADHGRPRERDDRPRAGGKRPFHRPGFERNQGTEEPSPPPRPRGPNREPRPSEAPEPTPPPRPTEPAIPPPGPPERGRAVKRRRP